MGKNGVCVDGIGDGVSVGFGAKGKQDANAMTKTKGIMNLHIFFMLSIKFCVVLETNTQRLALLTEAGLTLARLCLS